MNYYKNQFIEWLELTWYLISEPWIKLYEYWLDHFAPKLYAYSLFSHKIKKLARIGSHQNLIDWVEAVYKKSKLTRKQADKLIELIKTKPANKRMEVYIPKEEDMFDKEEI